MASSKHIDLICAVITAVALLITVLFMNGGALGVTVMTDGDGGGGYFTDNDLDGSWDASGAEKIVLTGGGANISGGAYFAGGEVCIASAGRYVLSGSLEGRVVVDVPASGKVWLLLDGAAVKSSDGAAIVVEQAEKVFITLAEGSENLISSSAFTDDASGVDGAVYSRDDLTVNGSGSLTVESAGHGIVGNDDLVLTGGVLDITAVQDGVHANDSARIHDARVTVSAGDDAVTVSNDDGTGFFYMDSGSLTVTSCYEGVEAQQITVDGGDIDIISTDDGLNATEIGSVISITGGSVRVVNEAGRDADGLDSNGSIHISGGYVFISMSESGGSAAIDAGTETGGVCRVTGGTVIAAGSGTMAESFDSGSTQGFVTTSLRGSAGTCVTLTDSAGAVLIDETIPCAFSSLILSAPGLKTGDAVTLTVGGETSDITVDSSASAGMGGMGMMGGMGAFGGRGGHMAPDLSGGELSDSEIPQRGGTVPGGESAPEGGAITPGDGPTGFGSQDDTVDPPANDGTGGGFPVRGNRDGGQAAFGDRGSIADRQSGAENPSLSQRLDPSAVILTAFSAVVLALGIVIAVKVRH